MGFRHLDHSLSPPTSRGNMGGTRRPHSQPPTPAPASESAFLKSLCKWPLPGAELGVASAGGGVASGDGAWPRGREAWPPPGGRGLRRRGRVNCIEVAAPVHSRAVQSRGSSGAPCVHLLPPLMGWTKLPRKSPPSALDTAPITSLPSRVHDCGPGFGHQPPRGSRASGPVPSRASSGGSRASALTWSGQAAAEMNNLGEAGGCPAGRAAGTRVSLLPLFPVRVSLSLSLFSFSPVFFLSFSFFFFPMCFLLCVWVLSLWPRWGFSLALTFHRKRGSQSARGPQDARGDLEVVGRALSLAQIPGLRLIIARRIPWR